MEIIKTYSHIIGPLVIFIFLTITVAGISICKEIYNINIFKSLGITAGPKIPKTIGNVHLAGAFFLTRL